MAQDIEELTYTALEHMKVLPSAHVLDELEMYSFPQTWGSTACGNKGMGGATITRAQMWIFVLRSKKIAVAFVPGPYIIRNLNYRFWEDLCSFQIASEALAPERYEYPNEPN